MSGIDERLSGSFDARIVVVINYATSFVVDYWDKAILGMMNRDIELSKEK